LRVEVACSLVAESCALLADDARRASMRERALAFHAAHRGATERTWRWLAAALDRPPR
jgi:3-deoxy-D-manno-octulosonic-acid transferase